MLLLTPDDFARQGKTSITTSINPFRIGSAFYYFTLANARLLYPGNSETILLVKTARVLLTVDGGSAQHSAMPPGTYVKTDSSAWYSKSIKYVIRKHLVICFFRSNNIIDYYLVKLSAAMRSQLATAYSVKYDVLSKPERIV